MFLLKPITLLRAEGLLVFLLGTMLYWSLGYSWLLFWSTILIPDISLLFYFFNKKTGTVAYNLTHAKILPSMLAAIGILNSMPILMALSIIWFVHIGVDRFFGFGLKYARGFKYTHLGIIGRN